MIEGLIGFGKGIVSLLSEQEGEHGDMLTTVALGIGGKREGGGRVAFGEHG